MLVLCFVLAILLSVSLGAAAQAANPVCIGLIGGLLARAAARLATVFLAGVPAPSSPCPLLRAKVRDQGREAR